MNEFLSVSLKFPDSELVKLEPELWVPGMDSLEACLENGTDLIGTALLRHQINT